MTAIDCEKRRCRYNVGGVCDAEIVSIRKDGRCVTVRVERLFFGVEEADA
ncbi:hypothetical protein [Geoglobus ahangari]